MQIRLKTLRRRARLLFLPAYVADYNFGKQFNAHGERRPQRFQAVVSGMDPTSIAAERHYSPHKVCCFFHDVVDSYIGKQGGVFGRLSTGKTFRRADGMRLHIWYRAYMERTRQACSLHKTACVLQVQAAAAGAMGALGVAAGAVGFYGVAPAQLLTVTSAFAVFMVCSAAGKRPYFIQASHAVSLAPLGHSSDASELIFFMCTDEHLMSSHCIWKPDVLSICKRSWMNGAHQ